MSYFSKIPLVEYELKGQTSIVKDILRRSSFISEYKPLTDLYNPYTIKDGETAQNVSLNFYGSVYYHWVVYIFNEIHDPAFDWPLSQRNIELMCIAKYTQENMYKVRHYERDGVVVGEYKEYNPHFVWVAPVSPAPDDLNTIPISFFDYEQNLNDKKRQIKIMRPELLGEFVKQFEASLNV